MKQKDANEILKQGGNVLLTGAAGSGKTHLLETFIRWARQEGKMVAVTASTGVAAANINGTTIHNWSGIGVRGREELADPSIVNGIVVKMLDRYRLAIENTDILVVDEISMLNDYQLDAVDDILRGVRQNDKPFGGIQVVLCGDFFQLPPIAQNGQQWQFIVQGKAYCDGKFESCYLDENFRHNQGDPLIRILNAIRTDSLKDEHVKLLNDRLERPLSTPVATRLCSLNESAQEMNKAKLQELPGEKKSYSWKVTGSGKELADLKSLCLNKVAEQLNLRKGAVVIFTKNDPAKRYFNGTIGEVVGFDEDGWPNVQLNGRTHDGEAVSGNILYGITPSDFWTQDGAGNRLATITQVPLMLAWAITIHKSQGMTLEAASIDITKVWGDFGPGLGYVALSRVHRLKDLSLVHSIPPIALQVNPAALQLEGELQRQSEETYRKYVQLIFPPVDNRKAVQFITTRAINHHLDELIRNADKFLILIAPYIQLNNLLRERLMDKKREGVEITIICRGQDSVEDFARYSTKVKSKPNLHAKCYLSDKAAIVTSMNLNDFSQENNAERGFLIANNQVNPFYNEISEEARRLVTSANDISILPALPEQKFETHTIQNVEEMEVQTRKTKRQLRIQIVTTNHGKYLANRPGVQLEGTPPGFNWQNYLGQTVDKIEIVHIGKHDWITRVKVCKKKLCNPGESMVSNVRKQVMTMQKQAGYYSILSNFRTTSVSSIVEQLKLYVCDSNDSQVRAWRDSISLLQKVATSLIENNPDICTTCSVLLEYTIPLESRRIDALLLLNGAVIVIEFKGYSSPTIAAVDQAAAYSRDLKAYHKNCANVSVFNVLVLMGGESSPTSQGDVMILGAKDLLEYCQKVMVPDVPAENLEDFIDPNCYQPLPSLIKAARELFNSGSLKRIHRAAVATEPTLQKCSEIIHTTAAKRRRALILVSGVPGAGKTLVGLQIAHAKYLDDIATDRDGGKPYAPAVFLSGNGPLVKVLQYELKSAGGDGKAFVRGVHEYVKTFTRQSSISIPHHVLIYDEAQRAFDAEQVQAKHKDMPPESRGKSEPELFIKFAERVPEWSVVVGLIGSGQEIHIGEEGGISQWKTAIQNADFSSEWDVYIPSDTDTQKHFHGLANVAMFDELKLTTTIRFHIATQLYDFVKEILAGNSAGAKSISLDLEKNGYHLRMTRDLSVAKAYLKNRYSDNPDARFGIVASAKDKELEKYGIPKGFKSPGEVRNDNYGKWYANSSNSDISCTNLDMVATEFGAQGLELDACLLAWGTDLIRENGIWTNRFASGYRDKHRIVDAKALRVNSYRVLLTRGRDGCTIFVPPISKKMCETYAFLRECGFMELEA